jgi:hypothetical protein
VASALRCPPLHSRSPHFTFHPALPSPGIDQLVLHKHPTSTPDPATVPSKSAESKRSRTQSAPDSIRQISKRPLEPRKLDSVDFEALLQRQTRFGRFRRGRSIRRTRSGHSSHAGLDSADFEALLSSPQASIRQISRRLLSSSQASIRQIFEAAALVTTGLDSADFDAAASTSESLDSADFEGAALVTAGLDSADCDVAGALFALVSGTGSLPRSTSCAAPIRILPLSPRAGDLGEASARSAEREDGWGGGSPQGSGMSWRKDRGEAC